MHRRRARDFPKAICPRATTSCDPRLNAEQAIEVAFLVAELLKREQLDRAQPQADAASDLICFDAGGAGNGPPTSNKPHRNRQKTRFRQYAGGSKRVIRVSNSLLHEAFMRDGFTPAPADRSRRRPRISALALWAALTVAGGAARAQPVDCASLRAQLAAAVGEGAEQSQQFAAAADKQRSELTRTLVYARSLGCDRQQFLFFGDAPPAQCGTINARITAMRANLSNLQARAAVGSPAQRSALAARYEIYCRNGSPRQAGREKGFLENLFGERSPFPARPFTLTKRGVC